MKKTLFAALTLFALALAVTAVAPALVGVGDTAEAHVPNPTFKCYTGTVKVDSECDGSFELGVNEDFDSYGACKEWENGKVAYYQGLEYCTEVPETSCANKCKAEEPPADS